MSKMSTDKLTEQAVKQHDNIHPTYKASSLSPTRQRSQSQVSKPDEGGLNIRRRSRLISMTESNSGRTQIRSNPGLSIFRLVAGARAWQQKARLNSRRNSRPIIKQENTYRLEPNEDEKFQPEKVTNMLKDILESRLHDMTYNAAICKKLSVDLSAFIKSKVKSLDFPRYKYVCTVTIMEKLGQGMQNASRCVWNTDVDRFATYTYTNSSLVAVAHVHAVYFE
ncbi:dynein light chain Tctex-type 5-B [Patella vulgata]|uniref:dynein light chain Tctex-type 5-B n=1 Tax=Patella vulgata TaxID=6465 RepID=UPI0024A90AFE|nr:dynein light chain Tctex-type 5-B [Patella vulgata]